MVARPYVYRSLTLRILVGYSNGRKGAREKRGQEAAIRMAISTARNALAGIDGKLDPLMVVNREVV
jgi:hypothetical protein